MILSSNFWPMFWAVTGGGVAVVALLSLVIAGNPPSRQRRPTATQPTLAESALMADARHDGDQAGQRKRAA